MIYEDVPFVDRIDRVADHGFDTVEFWTWPDKDLDTVSARLDEHGVSLAGMAANTEPRAPEALDRALTDPSMRDAIVEDFENSIEVAARFDCPNLIVLVGPELEYTHTEMYESVVACLEEVAPTAEAAGVTLVVEPLNTAVDHGGYFLERSTVGFDIVRDVDSPAVKINFDVYHQQITEGNIIATLAENLDAIGHVHVADVPGRHEPGTGELNYPNVLAAIEDAGYDRHVGFEYRAADDDDRAVVLTPAQAHANVAEDTLSTGIHTFVEKPIAATLEDATTMVEAADASDAVAMVGYMKRYDPSYELAQERIDGLDAIDLVTAYDVDPDHGRIIEEVYDLVGGTPPADVIEASVTKRRQDIEEAIGTDDELLVEAYDFQLDHLCHDVNALRGLFGSLERIDHVAVFAEGRYATAHLRYEDGIRCVLETGDSDRKWFEEFIRVDGPDGMVTVDFSNPFIKNTPTELRVKEGTEELSETVSTPSYEESFKRELAHFRRCIEGESEVRTTFAEAREDLRVIIDLFRTYRGEQPR